MKRLLFTVPLIVAVIFVTRGGVLSGQFVETPVGRVSISYSVSVTTHTWTAISTTTLNTSFLGLPAKSGRNFMKLNNPSAVNSNAFNCVLSTGSTPSITIGTGDIEIPSGSNPNYEFDNNFTMYCVSRTAAQTIYVREYGQ
jgi:hypothetical protein